MSRRLCWLSTLFIMAALLTVGCQRGRYRASQMAALQSGTTQVALAEREEPRTRAVAREVERDAYGAYDRGYYLGQACALDSLVQTEDYIPSDTAESGLLLANIKRGMLSIAGGSSDLVSADFEYNQREPAPHFHYRNVGHQRIVELLGMGRDGSYELKLSDRIPMEVKIESAGGLSDLNFENVPLTDLKVNAMAGATLVRIPGYHPYLNSIDISHRRGSVSLVLDGEYPELTSLNATSAKGDVAIALSGVYPRLNQLEVGSLGGDMEVDLTGRWDRITQIRIVATCGDLRLRVPGGLGVSVKVHHSCASICAVGLHKTWSSNAYINPAYGKTDTYLDIVVEATCHNVDIVLDGCVCPWWVW